MEQGKRLKASPAPGGFGMTYTTHSEDMRLVDFAALAQHTRLTPDEARKQMIELVNSIPDRDLNNYIAAQVLIVA